MAQKYAGGQAVIEGVMMRYGDNIATAIRKKGKIKIKKHKLKSLTTKYKILGLPFLRGIVALLEMLYIGTKSLMWSAKESADEDDVEVTSWQITLTVIISIAFSIGLFVLLPYILSYLFGLREQTHPIAFNLVDGMVKIAILLLYVYLIGYFKEIEKVFQYHGAEHKTINLYESGKEQTIKNSRRYTTIHNRCGTNFLFIVILTGVLVFSLIPYLLSYFIPGFFDISIGIRYPVLFLARILLLPVIAGIAYEWLRINGRYPENKIVHFFSLPGRALQHLTTREPNRKQLEVAFAALNAVIKEKK